MDTDKPIERPAGWGDSPSMSAWDALMWRAESDPRTSSAGMLLEVLDREPDWERLVAAHQRTVDRIPRLRERVVEPLLPVAQPAWTPDRDFDLRRHVRRISLPDGASERDVLDLCEALWEQPLDPRRPPWEGILVTGLAEGRAAYVFRCHHAMTDGTGLVQLLDLAHSRSAEPSGRPLAVAPERPSVSAPALTTRGLLSRARMLPRVAASGAAVARHLVVDREAATGRAWRYLRSATRVLGPNAAPGSPLLSARSTRNALLTLDVDLASLKAAGRAASGSLNDAYLAAVLGGLRRYHDRHDVHVESIPLAMPVSLRSADDATGGNRFAGVRFAAPLSETDPATRIRLVGEFVRSVRDEPAIGVMDHASEAMTLLPDAAIIELTARLTKASDLQVSNIRGLDERVYIAGAQVVRMYPLGPRPGVAAMVTLMTYDGHCGIGLNVDAQVFPELDVLEECLVEGFTEVLALAAPGAVAT